MYAKNPSQCIISATARGKLRLRTTSILYVEKFSCANFHGNGHWLKYKNCEHMIIGKDVYHQGSLSTCTSISPTIGKECQQGSEECS